ncbi:MAG: VanW family protein [Polyangiaceae bacterium]
MSERSPSRSELVKATALRVLRWQRGAAVRALVIATTIGVGMVAIERSLEPTAEPAPSPAPAASVAAPANVPTPKLRIAGHDLPANSKDPVGDALDLVRRYAVTDVKLALPDGRTIALRRADFGLEIDRLRVSEFVNEALRPDSAIARAHFQKHGAEPLEVPLPIRVAGDRALSKLVDLKAELDSPPQDASIDLEARKVRPEKIGYRLDVYGTLARLESAFRRGETKVDAAVEQVLPRRLASQIGDVRFDQVLGFFETRYNQGKRYEDRTFNLRLAASKVDGVVLLPGEVFDFNALVGPRDEAHGYRIAPVIAQGELVDGIGGGTCQISGTLHGAVFFSGLEIVERYPHSRPSSYIALGLDATVSYPNITYRFKNTFDFPIVLHEKVAGGVVRAEILGPRRALTVSYFRRIDDVLPFEEVERPTDKLREGDRVVTQRGIPGFVATASRVVRDGSYAERTKWVEKYPPTTQIVAVGTGSSDVKASVKEDAHPEYTVDEYRVMTEGPGIVGPGGSEPGIADTAFPGKTGEKGWIKDLGLEKTPVSDKKGEDDKNDGDKPEKDKPSKDKSEKADKSDKDKSDKDKSDKPSKKKKKKASES